MAEITLYNFSKRVNSTAIPSQEGTAVTVNLKDSCSFISPRFILKEDNIYNYNYLKFQNRYYYITDTVSMNRDIFELTTKMDVLASYKADILNTSAYVDYCTSEFINYMVDERISTSHVTDLYNITETVKPYGISTTGCYFVSVLNDNGGFSQTYAMTFLQFDAFATYVSTDDTVWEQFRTKLNNPFDAIIEAYKLPVDYSTVNGVVENVKLGTTDTGLQGKRLTVSNISGTRTVNIPWQFGDYRDSPPFASLSAYFPVFNYFNVDTSYFVGSNASISFLHNIDLYSGDIELQIRTINTPVQVLRANTKTSIPISQIQGRLQDVISGGVGVGGAVGAVIAGGTAALPVALGTLAITGVNALNERVYQQTGTVGGKAWVYFGDNVRLYLYYKEESQAPDDYVTKIGRPLKKVRLIGDLSGYVQTLGCSVSAQAGSNIIEEINRTMDGGVYIE